MSDAFEGPSYTDSSLTAHVGDEGRAVALDIVESCRIDDPEVIAQVINGTISFTEFQTIGQFDPINGLYPNFDFGQGGMKLLPELLSPEFGQMYAELALMSSLIAHGKPAEEGTTFLGLGAGGGFLDADLIEALTKSNFYADGQDELPQIFTQMARDLSRKSQFVISDGTEVTVERLGQRFKPLRNTPKLAGRLAVQQVDATDFDLEIGGRGYVYSNELLDAVPVEPAIRFGSEVYLVRMRVKDINQDEDLTPEEFRRRTTEDDRVHDLLFSPVFVPLSSNTELETFFETVDGEELLERPEHDGIVPLHHLVPGIFQGAKASFEDGIVQFVDYLDLPQSVANWNNFINAVVGGYRIGSHDIDAQVSGTQIDRIAEQEGFDVHERQGLNDVLGPLFGIMPGDGWFDGDLTSDTLARFVLLGAMEGDAKLAALGSTAGHSILTYSF